MITLKGSPYIQKLITKEQLKFVCYMIISTQDISYAILYVSRKDSHLNFQKSSPPTSRQKKDVIEVSKV